MVAQEVEYANSQEHFMLQQKRLRVGNNKSKSCSFRVCDNLPLYAIGNYLTWTCYHIRPDAWVSPIHLEEFYWYPH